MKQKIQGFHVDGEGHWVADLACGHQQHVRHEPPWMERPWVLTPEGRQWIANLYAQVFTVEHRRWRMGPQSGVTTRPAPPA